MVEPLQFFERQLSLWPEVAERYNQLREVQTRIVDVCGFPVVLQHNPARVRSTGAKVDAASIQHRPCFLCPQARPMEQLCEPAGYDYQLLVNPFPIFPHHFTLPHLRHQPQDNLNLIEMGAIAASLPGMLTFFNGSKAGASAPDHLHLQAGDKEFLPIVKILEQNPGNLIMKTADEEIYECPDLPFHALHFVSDKITERIATWLDTLMPEHGLRNILIWKDASGRLHTLFLPRRAHRPSCYFAEDGFMVSPGAVDMAGVLILPRREDFDRLTRADILKIYDEVSYRPQDDPRFAMLLMS